ncbi:hypothetical protein RJT34_15215 [Clitoria ternatea]|uniref:GTD-binding domain-containing protein n=1 Tax=Clitoria ternatea TaxID=43366 RepID=A0AAN9JU90_CLITE
MAETGTWSVISRTKSDVSAMKDTLVAQQQLLQKLYAELDQEREASASAASEALDMILRLQGEMAAVKMEASHYKRMTEERIGHAEASIEAFDELMYQKEMEIASLEFQVQAYKHKLISLGCDLSASELESSEDIQCHMKNGGQGSNVRRLNSMPPILYKSSLVAFRKWDRSPSPVIDVIPKVVEENTDQEVAPLRLYLARKPVDFASGSGTLGSYLNRIKELDEQVRVISDCNEGESVNLSGTRGRSCLHFSQASTKVTCDQTDRLLSISSDGESAHDSEGVADNSTVSVNVHDVFEVPQTSDQHGVGEHGKTRLEKWNSDAENRLTKPDAVSEGVVEPPFKHNAGKIKGMLRVCHEIKTSRCNDVRTTIIGQGKEGVDVDCSSQAEFQKLNQRIERLERERIRERQEITCEGNDEEQLRLLKDIQSLLKSMQSEIRDKKTKQISPIPMDDDVSKAMASLQEAMLHFWL